MMLAIESGGQIKSAHVRNSFSEFHTCANIPKLCLEFKNREKRCTHAISRSSERERSYTQRRQIYYSCALFGFLIVSFFQMNLLQVIKQDTCEPELISS